MDCSAGRTRSRPSGGECLLMGTSEAKIIGQLGVLADAVRGRLLLLLDRQELTVSELRAVLDLPQSTVSRHLRVLGEAGWVFWRAEGTSRYYRRTGVLESGAARVWQVVSEELAETAVAAEDAARVRQVLLRRLTRSESFFSSAAGQWEQLRQDLFGPAPEARALLGLLGGDWVVGDLGCGTGQVAELLAPFVARVVGVDRSPEMLAAARVRLGGLSNVDLRQGELEALPLRAGELDAALIFLVLHYVADPGRALAEAARVLRPRGRLLVVELAPHAAPELRDRLGHVWQGFERDRLAAWLGESGFEAFRFVALPPEPGTRGPPLFAVSAVRGGSEAAAVGDGGRERRRSASLRGAGRAGSSWG